ncbi:MAG: penicillin-binding protein 2 [Elusimicrobiales bacterium]
MKSERNEVFLERIFLVFYIVVFLFIIKLINLQIFNYSKFFKLSERNRIRIIPRNAPRGNVITSDGILVATNRVSYSVMYFPSDNTDERYLSKISSTLEKICEIKKERIFEIIRQSAKTLKPSKLIERIDIKRIKNVYEIKNIFPEVEIVEESIRNYPFGAYLSHVIGYVGKIDERDVKRYLMKGYSLDSLVGKNGVELYYEDFLKGKNGGLFMEVDNRGRLVKVIGYESGEKGSDVYLTINWRSQKAAEEALRKLPYKRAAAVACEADSGRIIVYAVKPGYDPNFFVRYSTDNIEQEVDEFNIPIQGLYPPASTFKIFVTIAALESGKVDENKKFLCPGYYDAGNRVFKCWEKKGHGLIDMVDGLAKSCDVYYYNVGEITGPYEIESIARRFRLDQKTLIDMPYEKVSIIVGPKKRIETKGYWYRGDTINMSIGQGELLVTPIAMMSAMMALANGGKFYQPFYVDRVVKDDGSVIKHNEPKVLGNIELKKHTWDLIYTAMRKVVTNGTGRLADVDGVEVFGKTGTAQNPHGKDHAWFVGFAKKEGSKPIAFAIIVEHGEHGSSSAAPVAREIIKSYYNVMVKNESLGGIIE